MPLYTYQCDDCMLEFDRFKSVEKRQTHTCPECKKSAHKVLSSVSTAMDQKFKDLCGQPIWFPRDGRPYYDRALKREFTTKKEKWEYLNKNRLVMDGSENPKTWPIEAGDMRSREYRKSNRLED